MIKFIILIFCFLSLNGFCQSTFRIYNLKDSFSFVNKKNLINDPNSIFFLGNNNIYFISKSKLNIYDFHSLKWVKKNVNIITNTEVFMANFHQKGIVTKYDINQIDVNEDRNYIGFTLKYGMFKEIDLSTLKSNISLHFASDIHCIKYLRKSDKLLIFEKFYPDSTSKFGNLVLYEKTKIGNYISVLNISLQKIRTLEVSENEILFGGITANNNLWLFNHSSGKIETNVYANDTLALISAAFLANDSIALLYNNNDLIISAVSKVNYTGLIKYDKLKYKFENFIYNKQNREFIAKSGKDVVIFKIENSEVKIIKLLEFDTNTFNYNLSPDGNFLVLSSLK